MNKRLLIVDDSIFVFEEMKYMLRDSDFEIVGFAKSGEDAIELYEKIKPDIVTLDIIMPGMDGLDTAKILLKRWPDAKIVMVSSLAYDETMEQAKNIGALDFIFKPIEKDFVLEVLNRAIAL